MTYKCGCIWCVVNNEIELGQEYYLPYLPLIYINEIELGQEYLSNKMVTWQVQPKINFQVMAVCDRPFNPLWDLPKYLEYALQICCLKDR